jgi:hypothetical protein
MAGIGPTSGMVIVGIANSGTVISGREMVVGMGDDDDAGPPTGIGPVLEGEDGVVAGAATRLLMQLLHSVRKSVSVYSAPHFGHFRMLILPLST